ncbi:MAG TPA: methyl-accepting chemotaxis protein, partial [Gammaproteobacteria bacterium]|nr:methyl-accepting chemotaxis protein [Gammaproteobacteria bacterium]
MATWWRDLSFKWKLTIPVGILTGILVVVALISLSLLSGMSGNAQVYARQYMPGGSTVLEADRDLHQSLIAQMQAALADPAERQAQFDTYDENLQQARTRVKKAADALDEPEATRIAQNFQSDLAKWESIGARANDLARDGQRDKALAIILGEGKNAFDTARAHLNKMTEFVDAQSADLREKVAADVVSGRRELLVALVLGLLVAAFVIFKVPHIVLNPLRRMSDRVEALNSGDGDLTLRLDNPARDEIGQLSDHIDAFLAMLNSIVGRAVDTTGQVSSAAEELSATSNEAQANVDAQHRATDQVSTATNEMTATIQEVARNTGEVSETSSAADTGAAEMASQMQRTVANIEELSRQLEATGEGIGRLTADAEKIGTVLEVINGV